MLALSFFFDEENSPEKGMTAKGKLSASISLFANRRELTKLDFDFNNSSQELL